MHSARAQLLLNTLVASNLIGTRKTVSENSENFWSLAGDLEEFINEGRVLSLNKLPADLLKRVEGDFVLFKPTVPAVGSQASILVPPILIQAALEEACRQADAMKVRKAHLTVDMLLSRLQRQIEEQVRLIKEV